MSCQEPCGSMPLLFFSRGEPGFKHHLPHLKVTKKAPMPAPISLLINKSNFVKQAIYNRCGVVQIWLFSLDFDSSSVTQFILME